MTHPPLPDAVIERLRFNLRAAGIAYVEQDLVGIVEKGFLGRLAAIERLIERTPVELVPDYLSAWGAGEVEQPPMALAAQPAGRLYQPPPPGDSAANDGRRYALIGDIAGLLRARAVSPVELLEETLARIDVRDTQLNAFQLLLTDQARAQALRAEHEIAAGAYRGPLHGVPLAVKDLLALEGTPTTAGSKILAGSVSSYDAAAVERLRAAGAVIVGKTRLSEFAYSPGSTNAHYGPTRNPWNLEHDTGGSSSGSAAAVADGLVYGALGSDTGGSIRIPAAQCGIVGLKPTYGRISLYGAITLSWSLDHLGPLTRSVGDAALLLAALAGHDARDARTRPARAPVPATLDAGVSGLRVGVLRDDGSGAALASTAMLGAWRASLAVLERAGAELVAIDLPELEDLRLANAAILAIEATAFHQPYLQTRLDDYGEFMRQRILAAFVYDTRTLVRAQQARATLRARCAAIFERVDLLSTPTLPGTAPALGVPGSTAFTLPFNGLGWPAISLPVGLSAEGLPLGLQLVARPWDEATLLRAAYVVEAGV